MHSQMNTKSAFVALNNNGAMLLQSGHFKESIAYFSSASELLYYDKTQGSSSCFPAEMPVLEQGILQCAQDEVQVLNVPVDLGEDIYIFLNPMVIPLEFAGPSLEDHVFSKLALVVALYNLALSYHLSALEADRDDQQMLLAEALKHYEISYNILLCGKEVVVSQAMVLLNNIGHIHLVLRNNRGARSCFEYLLFTMMLILETGRAGKVKNWENFMSNVMDLIQTGQSAAAAA